MDPFEIETSTNVSTPSPQNNGSGESVQSDDFVKVDDSSLLLNFNSDNQSPNLMDNDDTSPSEPIETDNFMGLDNRGFMDSPADVKDDLLQPTLQPDVETDKYSSDLLNYDETIKKEPGDIMDPQIDDIEKLKREFGAAGDDYDDDFKLDTDVATELEDNRINEDKPQEVVMPVEKPKEEPKPFVQPVVEDVKPKEEVKPKEKPARSAEQSSVICTFCPGVWFDQKKMNPKVADLLYWRDMKKSGMTFGSIMLVLLSMTYFSLISVIAYLSLTLLGITMSFRIYKSILTAVQKSNDGHPFKECLDKDFTVSSEKFKEMTEVALQHLDCGIKKTKALFLVEDIVDSIKFGLVLWVLTYIGAWFNGMTLLILAFVAAFTLPKVYETHQTQIDHYLGIANQQIKDVMDKIKAKVPMLNKKKDE